jgi:hypothetical protein
MGHKSKWCVGSGVRRCATVNLKDESYQSELISIKLHNVLLDLLSLDAERSVK